MITTGLGDTESRDSTSKKDRTSRSTTDKPWKSKKNKMKKDEPFSISVYSNKDIQKDNPEKKISSATKKRLEAQTVAKQAQKLSNPNLSNQKKTIFAQKRNPNFFSKSKK